MQFSSPLNTILNYLRQDNKVDKYSIDLLLSGMKNNTLINTDDFLFVDLNEKDDYISFVPKKPRIEKLLKDNELDVTYRLIRPVRVDRGHEIYRNYLKTLSEDEIQKIDVRCLFNLEHDYRVIKWTKPGNHWDNSYDIIHLESIVDGKQFINLQDVNRVCSIEPNFDSLNIKFSEMKFGRLLKRILPESTTNVVIENISNAFKSQNTYLKSIDKYFKVVEGEEIKEWYHYARYAQNCGNLNGSCMRKDSCQDFFNIYTEPENGVKMLILTNPDDKLVTRALLWTLDDGTKYMDRIYGPDYNIRTFIQWGKDNGYTAFYDNGFGKDQVLNKTLKVNLNDRFPYLDTFRFMVEEESVNCDPDENIVYGRFFNMVTDDMKGTLSNYHRFDDTEGSYSSGLSW